MTNDHRVRIIGGLFKGRRLEVLDLEGLRPTTDRVRETVFNWLGSKVTGAKVLDLFAGSGALGLEALSRGASELVLVEKNDTNARLLQKTLTTLPDLGGARAEVVHQDALNYLKSLSPGHGFDLIFLDPPFASDLLEKSVKQIVASKLLNEGGMVYVEMGAAKPRILTGLSLIRSDTAGQCHFGLYERSIFC